MVVVLVVIAAFEGIVLPIAAFGDHVALLTPALMAGGLGLVIGLLAAWVWYEIDGY